MTIDVDQEALDAQEMILMIIDVVEMIRILKDIMRPVVVVKSVAVVHLIVIDTKEMIVKANKNQMIKKI